MKGFKLSAEGQAMTGLVLETTSRMKTGLAFPGLLGSCQEQVLTLSKPCFLSPPELHTGRAVRTLGEAKLTK